MKIQTLLQAFEQPFSTAGCTGKADDFVEKKVRFSSNQIWGSDTCKEGENLQVLYIMNLIQLILWPLKISSDSLITIQLCHLQQLYKTILKKYILAIRQMNFQVVIFGCSRQYLSRVTGASGYYTWTALLLLR